MLILRVFSEGSGTVVLRRGDTLVVGGWCGPVEILYRTLGVTISSHKDSKGEQLTTKLRGDLHATALL